MQVCLLEPDEAVRTALTASLEQNGWKVSRDEQAGDLSTWLEQEEPVALIAESTLPDITAKRVLRVSKKKGIPVIFLGHGRELEEAVDLMRKGAIDFFEKPFNQKRLLNLLESLIVTKVD
jgi:DNA-binding NtrC family response regulator